MKSDLVEFRGWLNKMFKEGKLNNISQTEHWIDLFEELKRSEKKGSVGE